MKCKRDQRFLFLKLRIEQVEMEWGEWKKKESELIGWMDGWMVMRRGGKKSRAAECPVFIFSPERKVEKSFESGWAGFDLKQEDFPRLGPASS